MNPRVVALVVLTLALAGCSGDTSATSPDSQDAPPNAIQNGAKANSASEAQLEALADGEATFQEYQDAVRLTVSCLRDAGIDVIGDQVDDSGAFPRIPYSYASTAPGMSSAQVEEIADRCMTTHSAFIEAEYQTGDSAIEAKDKFFEGVRDEFVACVADAGAEVDPTAPRDELAQTAMEVELNGGPNCFFETGAE